MAQWTLFAFYVTQGLKWIGLDDHLKTQTYLEALENLM